MGLSDDGASLAAARSIAERIAVDAGRILKEGWESRPTATFKSGADRDPVTEFDRRAEALIVEGLRKAFPDDAIIGEEGARVGNAQGARAWYIDPLDGTNNFLHGLPIFAVSIGLARDAEPLVGVVHAPVMGWTFSAHRGGGATRDGTAIRVSSVDRLARALVATGFPSNPEIAQTFSNQPEFAAFTEAVQATRRLGSAALDLCFVACGWLDGFWERSLSPWDMAGGAVIATEAGGRVSDLDQNAFDARTGRVLASNGAIHGEMSALLARVAVACGQPWP